MLRKKNFELEFQVDWRRGAREFLRFLLENVAATLYSCMIFDVLLVEC